VEGKVGQAPAFCFQETLVAVERTSRLLSPSLQNMLPSPSLICRRAASGKTRICDETHCGTVCGCGRTAGGRNLSIEWPGAQHHGRGRGCDPGVLEAPADAGNSTVTLGFSFKRDGTLIGPPTATHVDGDAKASGICRRGNRGSAALPALELFACACSGDCRQHLHFAVHLTQAMPRLRKSSARFRVGSFQGNSAERW
jgi:hypothetical protein